VKAGFLLAPVFAKRRVTPDPLGIVGIVHSLMINAVVQSVGISVGWLQDDVSTKLVDFKKSLEEMRSPLHKAQC
jgi:hypothetical protein